jgi:hypothetical protein
VFLLKNGDGVFMKRSSTFGSIKKRSFTFNANDILNSATDETSESSGIKDYASASSMGTATTLSALYQRISEHSVVNISYGDELLNFLESELLKVGSVSQEDVASKKDAYNQIIGPLSKFLLTDSKDTFIEIIDETKIIGIQENLASILEDDVMSSFFIEFLIPNTDQKGALSFILKNCGLSFSFSDSVLEYFLLGNFEDFNSKLDHIQMIQILLNQNNIKNVHLLLKTALEKSLKGKLRDLKV